MKRGTIHGNGFERGRLNIDRGRILVQGQPGTGEPWSVCLIRFCPVGRLHKRPLPVVKGGFPSIFPFINELPVMGHEGR